MQEGRRPKLRTRTKYCATYFTRSVTTLYKYTIAFQDLILKNFPTPQNLIA